MQSIDPNQKVAEVLEQHPQTYHVFLRHGCPDMRSGFFAMMARLMSVRSAAWIHSIPLDELVADLEKSLINEQHTAQAK